MTLKVLLIKNVKIFWKINLKTIDLLHKADLIKKKEKVINWKNYKKIKTISKNGWKNIKLYDKEIEEYEFYQYKSPI